MIAYLERPYNLIERPLWWHRSGLSETASGYGAKLRSSKMLRLQGEKKLRRIYITCYSNAGSAWIIVNKQRVYLRYI